MFGIMKCILFLVLQINQTTFNKQSNEISSSIIDVLEIYRPIKNVVFVIEQNQDSLSSEIDLARGAAKEGDRKLAVIIYLNIISKNPMRLDLLEEYVVFVSSSPNVTTQELDELEGFLAVSIFKVPANQVKKLLEISKKIQERRDLVIKATRPMGEAKPRNIESDAENLLRQSEAPSSEVEQIKKLMIDLNNIREEMDEKSPKKKLIDKAAEEIAEIYQAVQKVAYIDGCFSRLEQEKKEKTLSSDISLSLVQAIEATLPSLYAIKNNRALPTELKRKVEIEFQKKLQDFIKEISTSKSLITIKKIDDVVKTAMAIDETNQNEKWEDVARKIDERLKEISSLVVSISDSGLGKQTSELIKPVQDKYNRMRRGQYLSYQKWAAERLEIAFKEYNAYKWTNPGNKAFDILTESKIHTVDLGLLSPDTTRFYNDIISRLLAQLGPEKLPEWYRLCVETEKVKLEDR